MPSSSFFGVSNPTPAEVQTAKALIEQATELASGVSADAAAAENHANVAQDAAAAAAASEAVVSGLNAPVITWGTP